jgi:hypothetical protein
MADKLHCVLLTYYPRVDRIEQPGEWEFTHPSEVHELYKYYAEDCDDTVEVWRFLTQELKLKPKFDTCNPHFRMTRTQLMKFRLSLPASGGDWELRVLDK